MQQLAPLVKSISDFFWNNILLFLLFGTGIWFTVRMRFIQVRRFGHGRPVCSEGSASTVKRPITRV